jgi:hypothetical protein
VTQLSQDDIEDQLEALLEADTYWSKFIGSQFVSMLETFIYQIVYRCMQYADSALAEGFISTATRRASILAGSEDKGYAGTRLDPSTGKATFTNTTDDTVAIAANSTFISDDQYPYINTATLTIPANSSVTGEVSQLEIVELSTTVTAATQFQELLLSKDITELCHKIQVSVTEDSTTTVWTKSNMFRLATSDSEVYVEFYKATDQLGIRFGDGTIGKIPPAGSTITVKVWCTNGDTTLVADQTLTPCDESADLADSITVVTAETISGGSTTETLEQTRNRATYQLSYDNQVVWGGDYAFFIKTNVAGITWVKCWGESVQEVLKGASNVAYINHIYISAWHPDHSQAELKTLILAALDDVPNELNKTFEYVEVNEEPFTITLTGTIPASLTQTTILAAVKTGLKTRFGQDSEYFDPKGVGKYILIKKKDLTSYLDGLDYFDDFEIEYAGWVTSNGYSDFVYLDVDNSTFTITYTTGDD